jgi:hypothetical protein
MGTFYTYKLTLTVLLPNDVKISVFQQQNLDPNCVTIVNCANIRINEFKVILSQENSKL